MHIKNCPFCGAEGREFLGAQCSRCSACTNSLEEWNSRVPLKYLESHVNEREKNMEKNE